MIDKTRGEEVVSLDHALGLDSLNVSMTKVDARAPSRSMAGAIYRNR